MIGLPPSPFLNSGDVVAPSRDPVAAHSPGKGDVAAGSNFESQANASAEARPTETSILGRQAGLSDGEAAIVAPVAEDASRLAAGRTAAATSEIMDATDRRDDHSIHDPDGSENIGEIFFHARKLMAEDNRRAEDFVDWHALEAALDEPLPTFIRDGLHLRRWA